MDRPRDGVEGRDPLEAALDAFVEGSGARMAALMDRSGALMAHSGFGRAGTASDLASLAAGMHAANRRICEITGTGAVEEVVTHGGAGRLLVREVPVSQKALLLVSVFDEPGDDPRVGPAIDALETTLVAGASLPEPDHGLTTSLLDRLDRTFHAE